MYKTAHFLYKLHIPLLPYLIQQLLRVCFSCVIPFKCKIGRNVHFAFNGLGVVIHARCTIGNNVLISHQVTLGGRGGEGVPLICDNVYIGAGAKILGSVKVGNNAKIGANAVVLTDVPDNATAVGVPAKIIVNKC